MAIRISLSLAFVHAAVFSSGYDSRGLDLRSHCAFTSFSLLSFCHAPDQVAESGVSNKSFWFDAIQDLNSILSPLKQIFLSPGQKCGAVLSD